MGLSRFKAGAGGRHAALHRRSAMLARSGGAAALDLRTSVKSECRDALGSGTLAVASIVDQFEACGGIWAFDETDAGWVLRRELKPRGIAGL